MNIFSGKVNIFQTHIEEENGIMLHKLPRGITVIIFVMLIGLQTCVLWAIVIVKEIQGVGLTFSLAEFLIWFSVVSIVGVFVGIAFMGSWKSWTVEDLIKRIQNPVFCSNTMIALNMRREQLLIENPELRKIPDPVKVTIEGSKK